MAGVNNMGEEGDMLIDHYSVLGVPSGEEGAKLSFKEISKAYRHKALELHPDKRPDDPNAHANFQRLKFSYEILKNDAARKLFDDLLRVRRDKQQRDREFNAKRRRMVSDLGERERESAFQQKDPQTLAEERISKQLKEEIASIRRKHSQTPKSNSNSNSNSAAAAAAAAAKHNTETATPCILKINPNTVLKVSWETSVSDYTASRLREIFQEFGDVEDVVIRTTSSNKKKKNKSSASASALVVMSTEEGAIAARGSLCGDLSNPLLVLPSKPTNNAPSVQSHEHEPVDGDASTLPPLTNLVGPSYHAYEDSILHKLKKAAEKQK